MRKLSFAVGRTAEFGAAPDNTPFVHAAEPQQRRLADAIHHAFRLALARGDIATAEELFAVLEGQQERSCIRVRDERRRPNPLLERARTELQARKSARYRRF